MAVALSLLVILPALAENTNGQVTLGRGEANELIVGVYDPDLEKIMGARNPSDVDLANATAGTTVRAIPGIPGGVDVTVDGNTEQQRIGAPAAEQPAAFANTAEDTFFDGKLYVSNRHDPFERDKSVEGGYNTVLVTQLGDDAADGCLTVTVRNTQSKASITLALVPSNQGRDDDGEVQWP